MGKAVLLDLDGTLLPIDIEYFIQSYFKLLTEYFNSTFEADIFINNLMTATRKMIENNGKKYNYEIFEEEFFKLTEVDNPDTIMDKFDNFYKEQFPKLREEIEVNSRSMKLINILKKKGYQLVLATNPVFPRRAIKERIRWMGIEPDEFSFITSYENMHYCKPALNYYNEIMTKLNLDPVECIMVGNDMQEDMVAGKLGMRTFLVTDYLINRTEEDLNCDWKGSFEELIIYFR
ncbi:MAG: HAD family hydrolase [Halanaerobiaceae bacterium]